jgi:hypothetical protein
MDRQYLLCVLLHNRTIVPIQRREDCPLLLKRIVETTPLCAAATGVGWGRVSPISPSRHRTTDRETICLNQPYRFNKGRCGVSGAPFHGGHSCRLDYP